MAHVYRVRITEAVDVQQLADELRDVPGFREVKAQGGLAAVHLDDASTNALVAEIVASHNPDPGYLPPTNPAALSDFPSLLNPTHHDLIQAVRALCLAAGARPKARGIGLDVTALQPGNRRANDPSCGVVIGTYWFAPLIELQIRAIRYTCGDVPILVCDDCSPGNRQDAMRAICQRYGVDFRAAGHQLGHVPGDLAAYAYGLLWAGERKLQVLAKLSQRWICLPPRWLQDGAALLLASGLPLATNQCKIGKAGRFPVRSEIGLLDVAAWNQQGISDLLLDVAGTRGHTNAEQVLGRILDYQLGGEFAIWPLVGQLRHRRHPGSLWHDANPEREYRQLGGFFGVDLGPEFSCCSSDHIPGYKG